jgi:bifunctional enzyme CysN/CysC
MDGNQLVNRKKTIKSTNLVAVDSSVSLHDRWRTNNHRSGILWFTGLSGSGKSTLAVELERRLFLAGYQAYVLDGDNIRHGISADLGFSPEDRTENIRRIGETAVLFANAGFIIISAFISPYRADRDQARAIDPSHFHEVYVKAGLETCESRDPKGLYAKARRGEILDFTGISAPYEAPQSPDLVIDTATNDIELCTAELFKFVERHFGQDAAYADKGD